MAADTNVVPSTLDAVLDRRWLAQMLGHTWPGMTVERVDIVETLITQATKIRLSVDVSGGPSTGPLRICIKGILAPTGAPASASIIETRFYRELAARLPVRVPPCIHAALDDAGSSGIIVMQDVIAGGATFLSALTPFTPDEARASVEQLAMLHAATWHDTPLFRDANIPSFLEQIAIRPIIPAEMLQSLLDGDRGIPLPPALRDAARLQSALERLAARIGPQPSCLVHGDAHAGNVYRDARGFGLVDWQILQQGDWAQDVAYHFAAVLSVEDRREHERELLAHYLDRLQALGGPQIVFDLAWTHYRAGMVYGFYLWAITRKVEPELTNEFTRRLGLAVHDLESFECIGA